MIQPITIAESPAQTAAVIHIVTARDRIEEVLGPAIAEVIGAVTAQGIGPVDPVFTYHREIRRDVFDLDVGVPVSAPVQPVGRVTAGELPAATVARTVYTGPYVGLGAAWGEFTAAVGAAGHEPAKNCWERYLAGPESNPDPATWQTELNRPVAG